MRTWERHRENRDILEGEKEIEGYRERMGESDRVKALLVTYDSPFCQPRCCAGSSCSVSPCLSRPSRWSCERTYVRTPRCRYTRPTPSPALLACDGACDDRTCTWRCFLRCTHALSCTRAQRSSARRWTLSPGNLQTELPEMYNNLANKVKIVALKSIWHSIVCLSINKCESITNQV